MKRVQSGTLSILVLGIVNLFHLFVIACSQVLVHGSVAILPQCRRDTAWALSIIADREIDWIFLDQANSAVLTGNREDYTPVSE